MKKRRFFLLFVVFAVFLSACNLPLAAPPTSTPTATFSPSPTATNTFTPSPTATFTFTPSPTWTPTMTLTPSITPTPTFAFPSVVVTAAQAHCRYGPNVAYLHAADLYKGDTGTVRSKWYLSKWLLVKFDKLDYFCWVAPSVVEVTGDLNTVITLTELDLQRIGSNTYGPPDTVTLTREGDKVTISWSQVHMTEDRDRGYFLDLFVCQNGNYLWYPIGIENQYITSVTVKDEAGCNAPSQGVIYSVEKHGYSQPKPIPWVQP